jgi:hypothetical protein
MATQDKTVKITIVVDPQSATLAKRQIIEIKEQVDALVKSVQSLGGFLGGGGGMKMGTQPGQAGTSAATQAMHGGGGSGGGLGGVQSMLTIGAAGGSNQLKKFAEDHKAYAKSVKADLSALTAAGTAEVTRMTGVWAKFKAVLSGIGKGGAPPGAPPGAAGGGGGGAGGGGGGGIAGRGGFIQNTAQALGVPGWAIGAAGIGGAVVGAGLAGWSAWSAQQGAANQYALNSPMYGAQVAAQGGGMFGGNSVSIRHGDIARSWAISQVKVDKNYSKANEHIASAAYKEEVLTSIKRQAPMHWGEAFRGGIGSMWGLAKSNIGNSINDAADLFSHPMDNIKRHWKQGMFSAGNVPGEPTSAFVAREAALREHAMDQPKRRQELIESYMAAHPVFGNQLNEFYNNSLSDLSLSRSAGISGAFVKNKDGTFSDSVANFKARADLLHVGAGELAGFQQTMGATAGRGFFGSGAALISPQAGGLSNAANIFGIGAQFNGGGGWGGASGFMKGIQGQIGRGGLDVTAGVSVANMGMAAMTSGNFQADSGSGMMSTMLEASAGGSTGRDMRFAREAQGGFNTLNQGIFGGGMDPLQKALNYSAAMEVGGDLPWQTQKTLASMDAATMMEVLRNPQSAQAVGLVSKGITADLVRKYFTASSQRMLSRIVPSTLTGRGQQAYANYQSSGGSTKYLQGLVNNVESAKKTKGGRKKREKAVSAALGLLDQGESDLASLFEMEGVDHASAMGTVRSLMSMDGVSARLHGKGAHRSDTTKSNRGQVQKTKAKITKEMGDKLAEQEGHGKHVSNAVGNVQGNADNEEAGGKATADAVAGGGDLNATIGQLDGILRKFVGQLHSATGTGAAPPYEGY